MITSEILTTSLERNQLSLMASAISESAADRKPERGPETNYEMIWHTGMGNDYY